MIHVFEMCFCYFVLHCIMLKLCESIWCLIASLPHRMSTNNPFGIMVPTGHSSEQYSEEEVNISSEESAQSEDPEEVRQKEDWKRKPKEDCRTEEPMADDSVKCSQNVWPGFCDSRDNLEKGGERSVPVTAFCSRCAAQRAPNVKLLRCSGCMLVHYCDVECQRLDWARHKPFCSRQGGKFWEKQK